MKDYLTLTINGVSVFAVVWSYGESHIFGEPIYADDIISAAAGNIRSEYSAMLRNR